MRYFVEIVNSQFNLSVASKKLIISQPALSQIIKSLEAKENMQLFDKNKGRLTGLTKSGEVLYKHALILTANYATMLHDLRETTSIIKGEVRIGVPPLVLGFSLSEVISQMISNNPDIDFKVIEAGANTLKEKLISSDLDLAVLLSPTELENANEYPIQESEYTAFMGEENPLAKLGKLAWSDLNGMHLALVDSTFMTYYKVMDKLASENIIPKRTITSANLEYLIMCTKRSSFITILPSPIKSELKLRNIVEKPFLDPIKWKSLICQLKKNRYSKAEKLVICTIRDYFSGGHQALEVSKGACAGES